MKEPKQKKSAKQANEKPTKAAKSAKGAKGAAPGKKTRSKIGFSDTDVRYIRTRTAQRGKEAVPGKAFDIAQSAMAEKFKTTTRTIWSIATKKTYADVKDA